MAGLDPATHVFVSGENVDARLKARHDVMDVGRVVLVPTRRKGM